MYLLEACKCQNHLQRLFCCKTILIAISQHSLITYAATSKLHHPPSKRKHFSHRCKFFLLTTRSKNWLKLFFKIIPSINRSHQNRVSVSSSISFYNLLNLNPLFFLMNLFFCFMPSIFLSFRSIIQHFIFYLKFYYFLYSLYINFFLNFFPPFIIYLLNIFF